MLDTRNALFDAIVHSQDIALPLTRQLPVPAEHSRQALRRVWAMGWPSHAERRLAGFALRATDTDWAVGAGPEIAGPALALLLLSTGRTACLDALLDLVGIVGLWQHPGPPPGITITGAVLGAVTLAFYRSAGRGNVRALRVVVGSRVVSALLGLPVFFTADAPGWPGSSWRSSSSPPPPPSPSRCWRPPPARPLPSTPGATGHYPARSDRRRLGWTRPKIHLSGPAAGSQSPAEGPPRPSGRYRSAPTRSRGSLAPVPLTPAATHRPRSTPLH
ncbi:hypothetical protein ACWCRD_25800 [Streptomyces sp. NPDC002092]